MKDFSVVQGERSLGLSVSVECEVWWKKSDPNGTILVFSKIL